MTYFGHVWKSSSSIILTAIWFTVARQGEASNPLNLYISNRLGHYCCIMNTTSGYFPSLHPQTSNLLLTVSVHKPVFPEDGCCMLFLGPSLCLLALSSPSSHHLCSVHHFIILQRALLTSETPLCTQVLLRTWWCTSVSTCAHMRVSKIAKGTEAWLTGFVNTEL